MRTDSMSHCKEPSQPWTSASIRSWALSKFQDDFITLPHHSTVTFHDLPPNAEYHGQTQDVIAWPSGLLRKVLLIGDYDAGNQYYSKVYAMIHKDARNVVSYIAAGDEGYYEKLLVEPHLQHVDLDPAFANISSSVLSYKQMHNRLRALVCYLFLAAGHIGQLQPYSAFPWDFEFACACIARGPGATPLPSLSRSGEKKRARDVREDEEDMERTPNRRKRNDASSCSSENKKLVHDDLVARVREQDAEISILRSRVRMLELDKAEREGLLQRIRE
jgi:hypothetical protein